MSISVDQKIQVLSFTKEVLFREGSRFDQGKANQIYDFFISLIDKTIIDDTTYTCFGCGHNVKDPYNFCENCGSQRHRIK